MTRFENADQHKRSDQTALFVKAQEVVEQELERSSILIQADLDSVPRFEVNEMVIGRVVGRGGFCTVREVNAIRLKNNNNLSMSDGRRSSKSQRQKMKSMESNDSNTSSASKLEVTSREYLARKVWAKRGGKYVIKQVEPELIQADKVTYLKGTIDLALETSYLASLNHPHILKIRGMSRLSPYEDVGYFIILDRLSEILTSRLNAWMQMERKTRGITGIVTGGRKRAHTLLTERLLVAYDIAQAMDYLHSKNIIYRDLKPDNIGFNHEGSLKIFDFGLAKELQESEYDESTGLYRMTHFTGAIRYMAPEVGLGRPYNLKADVYSWSMVMWYIMALEPPMGLYTHKMLVDRVFLKGYRPVIFPKWPTLVVNCIKASWAENAGDRPAFKDIMRTMREQVHTLDPTIASFLVGEGASSEEAP